MAEKDAARHFDFWLDEAVGWIGVFRRENVRRLTGEMGYYIAEEYWGKGITTEAIKQMCNYIFANTDIVRIFAEPFAFNEASCRVLEKAGFTFEGTLRQNAIKNVEIIDMKLYALVKPEIASQEQTYEIRLVDDAIRDKITTTPMRSASTNGAGLRYEKYG